MGRRTEPVVKNGSNEKCTNLKKKDIYILLNAKYLKPPDFSHYNAVLAHCHVLTCRSHPSSQIRAALSSAPLRESRLLTRVESTIFHPPGMTDPFRGTTFKRRQIAGTFLLPSPEHPHHPLPPPPRTPPRRRRAAPHRPLPLPAGPMPGGLPASGVGAVPGACAPIPGLQSGRWWQCLRWSSVRDGAPALLQVVNHTRRWLCCSSGRLVTTHHAATSSKTGCK